MLDATPVTAAIAKLISTGASEQALLAAVARLFPDLSPAELQRGAAGRDDCSRAAGGPAPLTPVAR
jgi:hypothetical protein